MKNSRFRHLNRSELVEIIEKLMNGEEADVENLPTSEEIHAERQRMVYRAKYRKTLVSTISVLIVVAAAAVLLSTLLFPVIQVSGDSMNPTLADGDVLVLLKNHSYSSGQLCCVSWQNKLLLKRVIGLPGDNINIDAEGNVYINDVLLEEPYVTNKSLGECDIEFPYQVPDDCLFVMGDHRDTSIDSRNSVIGCVEKNQVVGLVLIKVWPIGENHND